MKYIKISIIILLFVLLPIQSSVVDVKINVSNENNELVRGNVWMYLLSC